MYQFGFDTLSVAFERQSGVAVSSNDAPKSEHIMKTHGAQSSSEIGAWLKNHRTSLGRRFASCAISKISPKKCSRLVALFAGWT